MNQGSLDCLTRSRGLSQGTCSDNRLRSPAILVPVDLFPAKSTILKVGQTLYGIERNSMSVNFRHIRNLQSLRY